MTFELALSPRRVAAIAGVLATINFLMILGTYAEHAVDAPSYSLGFVLRQFTLAHENNIAVWYASMLLLAVALAMAACFQVDLRSAANPGDRLLSYGWIMVSALFAGLSLDELGSLHERLGQVRALERAGGVMRIGIPGWVGLLAVPIFAVCALLIAFAWRQLHRSRLSASLLALGFLLFASIPLQEYLEVSIAVRGEQRHVSLRLLEEGSELFASLSLLTAALWYAYVRSAPAGGRARALVVSTTSVYVLALLALLAAGFACSAFLLPRLMNLQDGRGVPMNWFPAALAAIVALVATLGIARNSRLAARHRNSTLLLLAALHVVLSMDHGSAHRFTEQILSGTPMARTLLDGALMTAVIIIFTLLVAQSTAWLVRAALFAWAALLLAAGVFGEFRVWLAFSAYVWALPGVLVLIAESKGLPSNEFTRAPQLSG